MFVESPVSNPALRQMGFYCMRIIGFKNSKRAPWVVIVKQDGINCRRYHRRIPPRTDDTVKKIRIINRAAHPIYHITTAGANVQSACKRYEESVIEVLEGRNIDNSLWIMIHDIDQEDLATEQSWENKELWKSKPITRAGLAIDAIEKSS
jgi:hypothetical protein